MVAESDRHESCWMEARREGERQEIRLGGSWTVMTVANADAGLRRLALKGARSGHIDASALESLDTTGAWLIGRTVQRFQEAGLDVDIIGLNPAHRSLLDTVSKERVDCPPAPKAESGLLRVIHHCGQATVEIVQQATHLVDFLGQTVLLLFRAIRRPRSIRPVSLISHMEETGLNALPIVGLISFLIGVVLAFQGADQLRRFGAEIFTVNLVAIGVLREMGILLTAIIVAGRSGSAFTAQIGTMKVNEEIDAMRTIGLDPMEVLVLPRLIAMMIVLPLLTFYADMMGLFGGAVMAMVSLDITFFQFARQLNNAVSITSFWVGFVKAPLFAFIIAMIGCYEGLQVERNAQSVGQRTTKAVVEAIFLVIVLDAMISILFSALGI